jgi:hypothetical protein
VTAPNQQQPAQPAPPANQPPAPGQVQQGQVDQGQQGQVQQPFPGQPGQPQVPNPWAGLLDVAPPQGQPGQQGQFQGQPGQQFGQTGWPQPPQQGAPALDQGQMMDLIGRAVQSAVDRRINQQNNPQWQQAHGQPGQPGQQPQQGQPGFPPPTGYQQPPTYQPAAPAGPSEADQREARMAAREYLGDRITFGSEAERAMAVDLTSALIPTQLLMGMTPNQAALNVAQTVADRVGSLRRTYEAQAVNTLRSRGLLVETPQGPAALGGSVGLPQGGLPVGTAQQQNTVAKAQKMAAWAQEENAARGWKTQPATA